MILIENNWTLNEKIEIIRSDLTSTECTRSRSFLLNFPDYDLVLDLDPPFESDFVIN